MKKGQKQKKQQGDRKQVEGAIRKRRTQEEIATKPKPVEEKDIHERGTKKNA